MDFFSWIRVTQETVLNYFPQLVVGSYGKKCYFIGRTAFKGEIVVGKVICTYLEAIYFAFDGNEKTKTSFEMLAYSEDFALAEQCSRYPSQNCPK